MLTIQEARNRVEESFQLREGKVGRAVPVKGVPLGAYRFNDDSHEVWNFRMDLEAPPEAVGGTEIYAKLLKGSHTVYFFDCEVE